MDSPSLDDVMNMSLFCKWPSAILMSASMCADAARLLHFPDPVLRAGSAVGHCRRQRRRRLAGVLPAARSAPLRHVRGNHGHAGRPRHRSDAELFGSAHLPAVSRPAIRNAGPGSCPGCGGIDGCSRRSGSRLRAHGRNRFLLFPTRHYARRPWPSSKRTRLILR